MTKDKMCNYILMCLKLGVPPNEKVLAKLREQYKQGW